MVVRYVTGGRTSVPTGVAPGWKLTLHMPPFFAVTSAFLPFLTLRCCLAAPNRPSREFISSATFF